MRNYERNQVHVDQCTGCGGLFLDRGELEALVAAENAWSAQQSQPQQQQQYQQGYQQQGQGQWQQPPAQGYPVQHRATSKAPYGYGGQGRRKSSFLGDLFG
jgi:Zn-finger nucleic acid-binding protein